MKYTLFHDRSFIVELNESTHEGFTASGLQILKKDFVINPTWKNTARVIMAHPTCRDMKMNDLVIFRKHAPKRLGAIAGEILVLFESQVLGLLRRANGDPWFSK